MSDAAFRAEMRAGVYAPLVEPINRLVDDLVADSDRGWMPYVAPTFGGVDAEILLLLQDPGPGTHEATGGSGFLCLENDDPSADLCATCLDDVGVPASSTTAWNAYPWYLPEQAGLTARHLEVGLEPLHRLLALLPRLQVVLLMGRKAQDSWRRLALRFPDSTRSITAIPTLHTSRRGITGGGQHSREEGVQQFRDDLASAWALAQSSSAYPPLPVLEIVGFAKYGVMVTADGVDDPLATIETLAEWSAWVPFSAAIESAPRLPGVYMAREGHGGPLVYVGMAGERRGSGNRPQGLRGRLAVYTSGKALASGLGEAVLDRAVADPIWLRERMVEVEAGQPRRAKDWGRLAFERADLYVRWASTTDKASARDLESRCLDLMAKVDLWNRLR